MWETHFLYLDFFIGIEEILSCVHKTKFGIEIPRYSSKVCVVFYFFFFCISLFFFREISGGNWQVEKWSCSISFEWITKKYIQFNAKDLSLKICDATSVVTFCVEIDKSCACLFTSSLLLVDIYLEKPFFTDAHLDMSNCPQNPCWHKKKVKSFEQKVPDIMSNKKALQVFLFKFQNF